MTKFRPLYQCRSLFWRVLNEGPEHVTKFNSSTSRCWKNWSQLVRPSHLDSSPMGCTSGHSCICHPKFWLYTVQLSARDISPTIVVWAQHILSWPYTYVRSRIRQMKRGLVIYSLSCPTEIGRISGGIFWRCFLPPSPRGRSRSTPILTFDAATTTVAEQLESVQRAMGDVTWGAGAVGVEVRDGVGSSPPLEKWSLNC